MNLEKWAKYWDEMDEKHHRFEKTFSVVVTGPSAAILDGKKKRAGQPATRGNYVTNAIMSHEKLPREIERLKLQVSRLQKARVLLQTKLHKLQDSGNEL